MKKVKNANKPIHDAEKLKKYITAAKAWFETYEETDVTELKVSFSNGNRKIGHVLNVSVAPIFTCKNCMGCGCPGFCYDITSCMVYPQVIPARVRNTVLAMKHRDEYFRQIDEKMTRRRKNKYMRFHVGGDIPDYDYFCRMVEIAAKHPDFVIWTYTKSYAIVNRYCKEHGNTRKCIPGNFSIMFSEWLGYDIINPYDFPVFRTFKPGEKIDVYECPGNCEICLATGRGCCHSETSGVGLHY